MMGVISESFLNLKNLTAINFKGKNEIEIETVIGDAGCEAIFKNAKYLLNLCELCLFSNIK